VTVLLVGLFESVMLLVGAVFLVMPLVTTVLFVSAVFLVMLFGAAVFLQSVVLGVTLVRFLAMLLGVLGFRIKEANITRELFLFKAFPEVILDSIADVVLF